MIKIKLDKMLIFVWAAIGGNSKESLAIWASEGSFEAHIFLSTVKISRK